MKGIKLTPKTKLKIGFPKTSIKAHLGTKFSGAMKKTGKKYPKI